MPNIRYTPRQRRSESVISNRRPRHLCHNYVSTDSRPTRALLAHFAAHAIPEYIELKENCERGCRLTSCNFWEMKESHSAECLARLASIACAIPCGEILKVPHGKKSPDIPSPLVKMGCSELFAGLRKTTHVKVASYRLKIYQCDNKNSCHGFIQVHAIS